MAVEITLTVPDWQAQDALNLLADVKKSRLLLICEPRCQKVDDENEDKLAPLVDNEPRVVESERPELDCDRGRVLVLPQREAV